MAAEKLLTEVACKAAKTKDKMYYLNDGAGLRLRVRPDGSRTWLFRFRLSGKEQTSGLGSYPKVTLQMARAKAADAKAHVNVGMNPSTATRIAKMKNTIASEITFGLIAKDWIAHNKDDWSHHHYERNEGIIRRYLLPDLENLPVDSITEVYLASLLKKIYDKGIKESARRARVVAAQIFSHARATHRGTKNPARDMSDNPYFKKPPVKNFIALPQSEVGNLIKKLNQVGNQQILDLKTVCGLKMALYTGLRDNSIRGAKWSEISFEKATWTVPASRMKSRREHTVPLPSQALAALRTLYPHTYRKNSDGFIFLSAGKYGFMAENTLRLALHRLGFKVTVHGMRSLITDVLNENHHHPDAIERQLDHANKDQVRKAYLRTNFFEERKRMMQWFSDWCDSKALGEDLNNVAPLRTVA